MNLVSAAYFIANSTFKGVGICMHDASSDERCVILPATKTKKLHTSRRDAFKPVNAQPIAYVGYAKKHIEFVHGYHPPAPGTLALKEGFEEKVAMVKTYPNMRPDLINGLIEKRYKGMVLEGSGIGQAPTNVKEHEPNYKALKQFIHQGGIVVLTSNCIFGEVHPYIYKNCRRLQDQSLMESCDRYRRGRAL